MKIASVVLLCFAVCAADATPMVEFEVRLVVDCQRGMAMFQAPPPADGWPQQQLCLAPDTILTGADVVKVADISKEKEGYGDLSVTLGPAGKARLAEVTRAFAGHRMAIMVHGEILSAPVIQGPILGGTFEVMGKRNGIDQLFRDLTNGPVQL